MELHVVAEGKQRVDVKYVEVKAYRSKYRPRVVNRHYSDYARRQWHDYTYSYFYVGPSYHYGDGFYLRYSYPRYGRHYGSIRRQYNNYLYGRRYKYSRSRHLRSRHTARGRRHRLNRWTQRHTNARSGFRSSYGRGRRSADVQSSRKRIRQALGNRSQRSLSDNPGRTHGSTGSSTRRHSTSSSQTRQGRNMRQAPSEGGSRGRGVPPEEEDHTPERRSRGRRR